MSSNQRPSTEICEVVQHDLMI